MRAAAPPALVRYSRRLSAPRENKLDATIAGVASSPIEILNYEAAEAGHGQIMSGTPGEAVMGEFYWKASCHNVI